MTSLQMTGHARPTKVVFYVRLQTESSDTFKGKNLQTQILIELKDLISDLHYSKDV